jgi:hypothetical protein
MTWLTGPIAIVISILALWVSIKKHRSDIRPVLVFNRREHNGTKAWRISNVGKGPALGVIIATTEKRRERWVSVYYDPIAAGEIVQLDSVGLERELAVVYKDVDGKKYTSLCRDNRTDIRDGDEIARKWKPEGTEIDPLQYAIREAEAILAKYHSSTPNSDKE